MRRSSHVAPVEGEEAVAHPGVTAVALSLHGSRPEPEGTLLVVYYLVGGKHTDPVMAAVPLGCESCAVWKQEPEKTNPVPLRETRAGVSVVVSWCCWFVLIEGLAPEA